MTVSEVQVLHSRKSTRRKSTFEPTTQSWSGKRCSQNLGKIPAKEPTFQQCCRLESCNCTRTEPSQSHPPRMLLRSWVIIYNYFKNLRTTVFSRTLLIDHFNILCFFVTVMLSLRTLTKYNLSGTAYFDSSWLFWLSNFIHKQVCNERLNEQKKQKYCQRKQQSSGILQNRVCRT